MEKDSRKVEILKEEIQRLEEMVSRGLARIEKLEVDLHHWELLGGNYYAPWKESRETYPNVWNAICQICGGEGERDA